MKVRDYVKMLRRCEHKFNTIEAHLRQVKGEKNYIEEKEFSIERNANGLEQYTLCIKSCGSVYFPYICMSGFYVK